MGLQRPPEQFQRCCIWKRQEAGDMRRGGARIEGLEKEGGWVAFEPCNAFLGRSGRRSPCSRIEGMAVIAPVEWSAVPPCVRGSTMNIDSSRFYSPYGRVGSRRKVSAPEVWTVVEVDRGKARWEDVNDTNGNNPPVHQVLLVKSPQHHPVLFPRQQWRVTEEHCKSAHVTL